MYHFPSAKLWGMLREKNANDVVVLGRRKNPVEYNEEYGVWQQFAGFWLSGDIVQKNTILVSDWPGDTRVSQKLSRSFH